MASQAISALLDCTLDVSSALRVALETCLQFGIFNKLVAHSSSEGSGCKRNIVKMEWNDELLKILEY